MFPDAIVKGIPQLVESLKKFTKTSDNLQKKLIFWTKVMAIAVGLQAIVIATQIYLAFK